MAKASDAGRKSDRKGNPVIYLALALPGLLAVTALISSGPESGGIVGRNPCLIIIKTLPPGFFNQFKINPTPTTTP